MLGRALMLTNTTTVALCSFFFVYLYHLINSTTFLSSSAQCLIAPWFCFQEQLNDTNKISKNIKWLQHSYHIWTHWHFLGFALHSMRLVVRTWTILQNNLLNEFHFKKLNQKPNRDPLLTLYSFCVYKINFLTTNFWLWEMNCWESERERVKIAHKTKQRHEKTKQLNLNDFFS